MMAASAVILAAGLGKRMRSPLPKVLHPVLGKPMVQRAGETAEAAGIDHVVVVVGHGREGVIPILQERNWEWAVQEEQLGTAHAVQCAMPLLNHSSEVLVLLGDVPLLRSETVSELLHARRRAEAPMAVLTTTPPDVTGYGRIIMDAAGRIDRIVEEKDATDEERSFQTINTGIMVFAPGVLGEVLQEIGNDNAQNEFYLTDAVSKVAGSRGGALSVFTHHWEEVAGVNDPLQLARCTAVMKKRVVESHLLAGVEIPDPDTVWIEDSVTIGGGVYIGRNCRLSGETVIGPGARLADGCVVTGGVIEPGCFLDEYSVIGEDQ